MQRQHFLRSTAWVRRGLALLLATGLGLGLLRPAQAVLVWQIQTLDSTTNKIGPNSLVLDQKGNPVFSYFTTTRQLRVVQCGNSTCSSNNRVSTVANAADHSYSSLALDSSGNLFVAYYDTLAQGVGLLVCKLTCQRIVIHANGGGLHGLPLILDSSGNPVIAYYDTNKITLIHCGDNICSSSMRKIMYLTQENVRWPFSTLVLDSRNNPIMAFTNNTGTEDALQLKFAYCDAACTSSRTMAPLATTYIDTVATGSMDMALGLDKRGTGRLVMSYWNEVANKLYLHYCYDLQCTSRRIGLIDNSGANSALVVDGNGASYISYSEYTNGGLKVAYCSDLSCQLSSVDNSAGAGWWGSAIALNSSGNPVILYSAGGKLKLATRVDDPPPTVTINQAADQPDPARNVVRFTATFNEAVTGFTPEDVTLGGTVNRTNATVTISGGPASYLITVNGALANGTVTAALAPNVVTDAAGNPNLASTSTDNSVTLLASPVAGWGSNTAGESSAPAGLQAVAVAGGRWHSLALKGDGTVVAWGCGTGNYGQCTVPAGLSNVTAIAAAPYHSLALKSDGTVVAWGCGGAAYGQCTVPAGLSGVKALAAGLAHSLALKNDGTVVAWGCGAPLNQGQCTIPAGLSGVKALATGTYHTLALKNDGTVVAWGGGNYTGERTVPAGLTNVIAVAAAGSHSLALKSDGTVVAWGENNAGQNTIPAGLTGAVAIAAGASHSLALKNDGTVVAWGCGTYNNGQCVVPTGLSGVVALGAGHVHSLALAAVVPAGGVAASAAVSPDSAAQSNAAPTLEGFAFITASVPVSAPVGVDPLGAAQPLTVTAVAAVPAVVETAAQTQQLFLPIVITDEAAAPSASSLAAARPLAAAPAVTTTTLPVAAPSPVTPTQPLSPLDAPAPVTATLPVTVVATTVVTTSLPITPPAVTTTLPITTSADANAAGAPDAAASAQQIFLPIVANLAGTALGTPGSMAVLALGVVVIGGLIWRRRRAKR